MKNITIFTPTYNRANCLERCYQSILNQKMTNIEWLVIDDGSSDNTKEIMDELISRNEINIKYIFQKNSGKQAAWNKALELSKTEFFIGLDSDDELYDGGLSKAFDIIKNCDDENIIGIRSVSLNKEKKEIDNSFFSETPCYWFDEFASGIFGERIDLFKTEIIRKFPYPISSDIKFIPEIWFYTKISKSGYKFVYTSDILGVFFNDQDIDARLSNSSLLKNAIGHFIARSIMLDDIPNWVWRKNPLSFIKTIIRYSQVSFYLNKDLLIKERKSHFVRFALRLISPIVRFL